MAPRPGTALEALVVAVLGVLCGVLLGIASLPKYLADAEQSLLGSISVLLAVSLLAILALKSPPSRSTMILIMAAGTAATVGAVIDSWLFFLGCAFVVIVPVVIGRMTALREWAVAAGVVGLALGFAICWSYAWLFILEAPPLTE